MNLSPEHEGLSPQTMNKKERRSSTGKINRTLSTFLKKFYHLVVRFMRADPEPDDRIAMAAAQGTIADADPDRVDRLRLVDTLKM
jgi:hypothetical protein